MLVSLTVIASLFLTGLASPFIIIKPTTTSLNHNSLHTACYPLYFYTV